MKAKRHIVIEENEISPLFEEIMAITGNEITGLEVHSQEGMDFAKNYPYLSKLYNILKVSVMQEQSTYNYERIAD